MRWTRPARKVGRVLRRSEGMATAELAMALPALVLVVSLLLTLVGSFSDASRASDAARAAARSASIGVSPEEARAAAEQVAPDGATVQVALAGDWARVTVTVPPRRWGPLTLPTVRATGAALLEPGLR
jgi:Flp pilus assembly protein TadG